MVLRWCLALLLGFASAASAQTYPSPTVQNLTTRGLLQTATPTTSAAGLNLPQGAAPTSPNNGDVWTTSAGVYARVAGTTVGPFGSGGSYTPAGQALDAGLTLGRTLAARASDVFNILDYGALGTGATTAIGTSYTLPGSGTACSVASLATMAACSTTNRGTPFAWMTNALYGLTFTMTTTTAQGSPGTSLQFLETVTSSTNSYTGGHASGSNGWSATVPVWQDPTFGSDDVATGMQVTGSCIAANTTVSTVGRVAGGSPTFGTITLSASTRSACASGTVITFTIAPATLQARTQDWLGIQGAYAAAVSASAGGYVYMPAGNYAPQAMIFNPSAATDSSALEPIVDLGGDGSNQTQLSWSSDLGVDFCGIKESIRTDATQGSTYHDFRVKGPSGTHTLGTSPNNMDGLCIGKNDVLSRINAGGNFHAGINFVNDHITLHDVAAGNDGYGIYSGQYGITNGGFFIDHSSVLGNTIASFGLSCTMPFDSEDLQAVSTGFGPYGFYSEACPSNITASNGGSITNTFMHPVFGEALGNGWIYSVGQATGMQTDIIEGGECLSFSNSYQISGMPISAVIYVGQFAFNNFINTDIGCALTSMADGVIEASGSVFDNTFSGDSSVLGQTSSIPFFVKDGGTTFNENNTFCAAGGANNTSGCGLFRQAYGAIAAGTPIGDQGYNSSGAYSNGQTFLGVAATPSVGSVFSYFPIWTWATTLPVTAADSAQVCYTGQPLYVTSTPGTGFECGLDQTQAVGTAWNSKAASATTITVRFGQQQGSGATGAATGLTAAGTTQATAYPTTTGTVPNHILMFSTVASGTGAILGNAQAIAPVGSTMTIHNGGANALLIYPQTGGAINALSTNAGYSLAAGVTVVFYRVSATAWTT